MKSVTFVAVALSAIWLSFEAVAAAQQRDRAAEAFMNVSTVLSSPRCANCHISGDAPLQGEDGHPHTLRVRRGADGRGTPAMRCSNCHQETSSSISHAPPGAEDWRLPPPATPMVWKGLTPGDQCRMLKDPAKNGNRTLTDLLDHATHDPLVVASWNPGPDRAVPAVSHQAFVEQFKQWIELGATCPQ